MIRWLGLLSLLIVCACSPPVTIFDRYSIVQGQTSFGSAVSVGKGYFFSARHVIDSGSFSIINKRGFDSSVVGAFEFDDVVLFKADIDLKIPMVSVAEPLVGEEVYFIQPVFLRDSSVNIFLFHGSVASVSKVYGFVDHPAFPGVSGGGVFNKKGELVGVMIRFFAIEEQVVLGRFVRVDVFEPILRKAK